MSYANIIIRHENYVLLFFKQFLKYNFLKQLFRYIPIYKIFFIKSIIKSKSFVNKNLIIFPFFFNDNNKYNRTFCNISLRNHLIPFNNFNYNIFLVAPFYNGFLYI